MDDVSAEFENLQKVLEIWPKKAELEENVRTLNASISGYQTLVNKIKNDLEVVKNVVFANKDAYVTRTKSADLRDNPLQWHYRSVPNTKFTAYLTLLTNVEIPEFMVLVSAPNGDPVATKHPSFMEAEKVAVDWCLNGIQKPVIEPSGNQ